MAKSTKMPSPLVMQLGEYVIPTILALAILGAIVLAYYVMTQPTQNTSSTVSTVTSTPADPNATAKSGDKVTVHYIGKLQNGTQFESSYGGQPFTFTLGSGAVIKGWDLGIVGMKAGEKKTLTIPPELGYGAVANGPIPANSTMIFEVELVKIN